MPLRTLVLVVKSVQGILNRNMCNWSFVRMHDCMSAVSNSAPRLERRKQKQTKHTSTPRHKSADLHTDTRIPTDPPAHTHADLVVTVVHHSGVIFSHSTVTTTVMVRPPANPQAPRKSRVTGVQSQAACPSPYSRRLGVARVVFWRGRRYVRLVVCLRALRRKAHREYHRPSIALGDRKRSFR